MATRTIKIKSLDDVSRGQRKDGKGEWVLREMKAETEDGKAIGEKLKTFSEFEVGQTVEVELEKEDHPTYGVSYMVRPVGKFATRKELQLLVERVNDLEESVGGQESSPKPRGEAQTQKTTQTPSDDKEDAYGDIPF